jgi:hypothetical protein|tara:strand:+ start:893 stop:1072 length:180 start_codon:yes stop_codon:yes gene_type:complete
MTNEDRLEERLIDAHKRGYYDKVITKIKELKITHPRMNIYDRYDKACNEYKSVWEKNNL